MKQRCTHRAIKSRERTKEQAPGQSKHSIRTLNHLEAKHCVVFLSRKDGATIEMARERERRAREQTERREGEPRPPKAQRSPETQSPPTRERDRLRSLYL